MIMKGNRLFVAQEIDVFVVETPLVTKGSSSGATLSFALLSKGEGGQSRYYNQEVAVDFRYPPTPSQTLKAGLK